MYLAKKGIIPPKEFYHDPKLHDYDGNTVAILLLRNKLDVPEEWRYESKYRIVYEKYYREWKDR